jgi:hypothetical protein
MTACMKVARIILGPLLALAFLLKQAAPFADAMAAARPATCGCHLAVCCCCGQTPANPNSAPRPVAPARTITQNDWQIVAAAVEQMFSSAAPSRPSSFHARPSLGAAPIPLYQRDCVLLI